MPGHVFESRLGIVHADCGLKDSRFEKVGPAEVKVRLLSNVATRLTWMLCFGCIYLSLKTNPITMETPSGQSILSDEQLLGQKRDQYCLGVIQTCMLILSEIKCCYLHEVLILFQQFAANLSQLVYKQAGDGAAKPDLYALRTADQRDKFEKLIQQATNTAELNVLEVIKRNDKYF